MTLSEKLRPSSFSNVEGQKDIVRWMKRVVNSKKPLSILLIGPPGSGKTTLALIYARSFDCYFKKMSAIFNGMADLKKVLAESKKTPLFSKQTILFIDEIHRFNKAQQDAFLQHIEEGSLVLIGATTENPSFSLNNALLSRMHVLNLEPLEDEDLEEIIRRYEKIKKSPLELTKKAREYLIKSSDGDARHLINVLENMQNYKSSIDEEGLKNIIARKAPLYDRDGEYHFNLISALHKSIRGSDPDASIYWLCRMLNGGEDPLYIARRLIRIASEDIGLADIEALQVAINSKKAFETLGSPEGELAIAQATIYLALSPKSNSLYLAYEEAKKEAKETSKLPPPKHILNAPNSYMKKLGYGDGYIYDHDSKNTFSGQNYFPNKLKRRSFYRPKEVGMERDMKKRLEYFTKLRKKLKG